MVDPYAVVRRLTGHELISPKDARLLTEAVDGLIGEIGSKDARIAELEAEVERLTKEAESYRDIAARKSNQVADMIHTEALSRTGAVKALDEDDYEEIISAAAINMRKATSGIRGQVVTVQDSLDWWVMKETERRILSSLTSSKPEQAVPSGWKLVPEEPSDEMVEAVRKKQSEAGFSPDNSEWLRDNYSVMLSAAPAAPTAGGGDA